jgi:hypothetical protein
MNEDADWDKLCAALTAVPEERRPLPPFWPQFTQADRLTLGLVLTQQAELQAYADQLQQQGQAIQKVVDACWQIPPTPLSAIPLRF